MSSRKGTCTSDNCDNRPAVRITFRDGAIGDYCQTCAKLIQMSPAQGVKTVTPLK